MTHQVSKLTLTIASILATTTTFAAGLDRSGQDVTAFFQDGTYVESVYTYIDADVSGYDNAKVANKLYSQGNKLDDIAEAYDFYRLGIKADVNDRVSVGVLYDEPFGAAVEYSGDNNFVSSMKQADLMTLAGTKGEYTSFQAAMGANAVRNYSVQAALAEQAAKTAYINKDYLTAKTKKAEAEAYQSKVAALLTAGSLAQHAGEGTNVEVRSESVTGIIGYKFGENKNLQVYGGPVAQRLQSKIHLRGLSYSGLTGYDSYLSPDTDFGWLAGVAYYKPEIGLKAALTYRSEIDHNTSLGETVPVGDTLASAPKPTTFDKLNVDYGTKSDIDITTPESFNFDFQTGINPTTLATAKVRYVPWSDFSITPPKYNATSKLRPDFREKGLPIVSYDDDQWQVELGLAKRLNPKLAVSGTVGWDSGAGNPTTSLGPVEGYYSTGLGAKYNVTDNWAISAGGKYLWFGDAEGMVPSRDKVANFEDNEGFIVGVKLSYQDKGK